MAGWQQKIDLLIFGSSVLYALYRFHLTTHSPNLFNQTYLSDYEFQCSLPLVCEWPKDVTDQEWQVVKTFYLTKRLLLFVFHSIGFRVISKLCPKSLPWFIIIYSAISIVVLFSLDVLMLLYANILIIIACEFVFAFINFPFKKLFHYFLFFVAVVSSFQLNLSRSNEKNLLIQVLFCWYNARCFSSSIDILNEETIEKSTLTRLSYLFYLPPCFFGPIYHFSDYARQLNRLERSSSSISTSWIMWKTMKIARFLLWAFILEEVLHRYLHSSSSQHYIYLLATFDSWSLAGLAFSLMILFYVKYLVIYGLPQAFSELDGFEGIIQNPPECIAHIHKTSYLWRTFDRGLYSFLLRYFYKPITGRDYNNPYRKMCAGVVCFLVIMVWHECHHSVMVWIALNILLSCCEIACYSFKQTSLYLSIIQKYLSPSMEQGIDHLFGSPYLMIAYLSNIFFLSNYETGELMFSRMLSFPLPVIPLILILYCGCNVSSSINAKLQRTRRLNKNPANK